MTRRDQWKKFIGHHRYALLTDECSIKAYKPELNMTSKPNLDITQCAKHILNEPLNINIDTPSSNFSRKDYGTPTTLPKDRKENHPRRISRKDGNIPEDYQLIPFQK